MHDSASSHSEPIVCSLCPTQTEPTACPLDSPEGWTYSLAPRNAGCVFPRVMLAMVRDLSLPDEKVPLLLPIASLKRNYEAASPVDVFLYQTQRHGFMAFCRAQTT